MQFAETRFQEKRNGINGREGDGITLIILVIRIREFLGAVLRRLSETVDTQSDYNLRKKHEHVSVQLYPRQVDSGDCGRGGGGVPYRPAIKI